MRNGAVGAMLGAVTAVAALSFWLSTPEPPAPRAPVEAEGLGSPEPVIASAPETPVALAPTPEVPPGLASAPSPEAEATTEEPPAPAETAVAPEETAEAGDPEQQTVAEAETAPPTIDVVRVDQSGRTVIAGRAPPGETVDILLDGVVVGSAEADGAGSFAAFLEIGISEDARALQLRILMPPEAVWSPEAAWAPVNLGGDLPAGIAGTAPAGAAGVVRDQGGMRLPTAGARASQPRLPDGGTAPRWSRAPGALSTPVASAEGTRFSRAPDTKPDTALGRTGRVGLTDLGPPHAVAPLVAPRLSLGAQADGQTGTEDGETGPAGEAAEIIALRRLSPDQPVIGVDEQGPGSAGPAADPQARNAPPIALWRPSAPRHALRRSPKIAEDAVPVETLPIPDGVAAATPVPSGEATGPAWRMPPQGRVSDWPARHGRRLDPSARPGFSAPPSGPRFVPAIPRYGSAPERPHVLPGRPGTILTAMPAELLALLAAERPLPARLTEIGRVRATDAPGAAPAEPAMPPAPTEAFDAGLPRLAAVTPADARVARPEGVAPAPAFHRAPDPMLRPTDPVRGDTRRTARAAASGDPDDGGGVLRERPSSQSGVEPRYLLSAPVLILPVTGGEDAPLLVQPTREAVALLQAPETGGAVFLVDSLAHPDAGAVTARGRGRPGHAVRIYVNALYEGETRIGADGSWQFSMPSEAGQAARLLRFDELDGQGRVTARLEVPFAYSRDAAALRLTERAVEIQRGDHLWRLAEQHYGEGLRYALIFEANAELIRDPDLIYPGQVFRVPELVSERAGSAPGAD